MITPFIENAFLVRTRLLSVGLILLSMPALLTYHLWILSVWPQCNRLDEPKAFLVFILLSEAPKFEAR